jgi:hypothetical protein
MDEKILDRIRKNEINIKNISSWESIIPEDKEVARALSFQMLSPYALSILKENKFEEVLQDIKGMKPITEAKLRDFIKFLQDEEQKKRDEEQKKRDEDQKKRDEDQKKRDEEQKKRDEERIERLSKILPEAHPTK